MRLRGSDRGALGIHWVIKLAVALGVLGVLGYDTFVTIATHLKAENDAQNAAYAASQAWSDASPGSPMAAYQGAVKYYAGDSPARCSNTVTAEASQAAPASIPVGCDYLCTGASNQSKLCGDHGEFSVDPDGTVHLVVRREANTLIFGHLGFMHSLLVAYEHGDANQSQD